MSTTITGVVTNGVVVPGSPLPEGARVEIRLTEDVASMRRVGLETVVYSWLTVAASLALWPLGMTPLYGVVALATGPATEVLCAWYVADSAFPSASLRRFLADTLPDNMLPVFLMQVASLPLSANGKLDRASLPAPRADSASVAPRTPISLLNS